MTEIGPDRLTTGSTWAAFLLLVIVIVLVQGFGSVLLEPPHIVFPSRDEEILHISREGSVIIEFDQWMRQSSVEESLNLDPPVSYETRWEKNRLLIKPLTALAKGALLTLSVKPTARNIFGKHLPTSMKFVYRVTDEPRVLALFPKEQVRRPDERLIIIFSHAMKTEDPKSILLSPLLSGEWLWHNPKTLVFTPSEGFQPETEYQLTSNGPFQTRDGVLLSDPINHQIETGKFDQIIPSSPHGQWISSPVSYTPRSSPQPRFAIPRLSNPSPWHIISKRGEDAFVFLVDRLTSQPVREVKIQLLNSEGLIQGSGVTNDQGIFFQSALTASYDFVLAQQGERTVLLHVSDQEGWESSLFGIPFYHEERPFRYQFLIEDLDRNKDSFQGVFLLKEFREGRFIPVILEKAEIDLLDEKGQLLMQSIKTSDEQGQLFFTIADVFPFFDGEYFLRVCPDGNCEEKSFYGRVIKGGQMRPPQGRSSEKKTEGMIVLPEKEEHRVGDEIRIIFQALELEKPLLVTVEKDHLYFSKVLIPKSSQEELVLKIEESMVPEVIITALQMSGGESRKADMKSLFIARGSNLFSQTPFEGAAKDLLEAFYPRQGTSIITASSWHPERNSSEDRRGEVVDLIRNEPPFAIPFEFIPAPQPLVREEKKVTLEVETPSFLRLGDEVTIPVRVRNKSPASKNLQMTFSAPEVSILSNERLFFGLVPDREQLLSFDLRVPPDVPVPALHFSISLQEKGEELFTWERDIPLEVSEYSAQQKSFLISESIAQQGVLEIPLQRSGVWKRHISIAPSPVSWIMDSLRTLVNAKPTSFEQGVFLMAVARDFQQLMGDSIVRSTFDRDLDESIEDRVLHALEKEQRPELAQVLSSLEQLGVSFPKHVKGSLINHFKKQIEKQGNIKTMEPKNIFQSIRILNALSSLTPAGVGAAHAWFAMKDEIPNAALVLLLLTFEDFRDAGIPGVQYSIEELIQLLSERALKASSELWLENGLPDESSITDFLVTSWYLEALVRQASARSSLPAVITWLVNHQYERAYQSFYQQAVFLQSMASYLRIFEEVLTAETLHFELDDGNEKVVFLKRDVPYQSHFFEEIIALRRDQELPMTLKFTLDQKQPLFFHVNWERLDKTPGQRSEGLSVYLELPDKPKVQKGDSITGNLIVISPIAYEQVVVIQPLIAGVRMLPLSFSEPWKTFTVRAEQWYVFDHLSAGESRISFTWEIVQKGIFETPSAMAYVASHPEIFATSNTARIEVGSSP